LWLQVEQITRSEWEVAALVACGLLNKHVAMRIGTKEKTVKVHRGRVMQKLQASSLAELVRMVDRLHSEPIPFVKLDGVEARRPRAADIITDVLTRERSQKQAKVAVRPRGQTGIPSGRLIGGSIHSPPGETPAMQQEGMHATWPMPADDLRAALELGGGLAKAA